MLDSVRAVLTAWHRVQARIGELTAPVLADARRDLTRQVNALIGPGFVTAAGTARLGDLARYLQAVELRIDKLRADPARDAQWTAEVRVVADEYAAEVAALPAGVEPSPELQEIRWMIEELRVALYAHPMRTRYPVSVKRIQKALDELPRYATGALASRAPTRHRGARSAAPGLVATRQGGPVRDQTRTRVAGQPGGHLCCNRTDARSQRQARHAFERLARRTGRPGRLPARKPPSRSVALRSPRSCSDAAARLEL